MKVKIIGSHMCQDTLFALMKLKEAGVEVDFSDIHAGFPGLKEYLQLRDTCPLYEEVKAKGNLGIPCFVKENGEVTLDLNDIL